MKLYIVDVVVVAVSVFQAPQHHTIPFSSIQFFYCVLFVSHIKLHTNTSIDFSVLLCCLSRILTTKANAFGDICVCKFYVFELFLLCDVRFFFSYYSVLLSFDLYIHNIYFRKVGDFLILHSNSVFLFHAHQK